MISRKNILLALAAVAIAALLYHQFRHSPEWRNFSWNTFWTATRAARPLFLLGALGLIYFTYFLRTWRWQTLMTPRGRFEPVFKGTVIGFTGMAFLGRPGDLVRPFYIARKHRRDVSPQMAVWVLERIFDMAGVVLLVGLVLGFDPSIQQVTRTYHAAFQRAGLVLSLGMFGIILLLYWFHRNSARLVAAMKRRAERKPAAYRQKLAYFLETLAHGTAGLTRARTLILAVAYTFLVWGAVSASMWMVVHAYPGMLPGFSFAEAVLLMGFTAIGSVAQLPAIGGGFQAATIGGLTSVFGADLATASSAALLIWVICIYAVTPIGAAIAAHEKVSWTSLEHEAISAELAEADQS